MALDDDHHAQMANDPGIQQFPQGSTYGAPAQSFGGAPAFGAPQAGGFGPAGGFSSTTTTSTFSAPAVGYGSQPNSTPPVQIVQNQGESLKNTGGAMQEGADVLVKNDNTDWINKKWRPAMGWIYMLTCTVDFVLFPIMWSILQALSKGNVTSQWQPLTLQGAGLYHIAMGAVLGIAAYGRTKEKIEGAAK
jgi:hypothetical protein